jgi:hypothetical protein
MERLVPRAAKILHLDHAGERALRCAVEASNPRERRILDQGNYKQGAGDFGRIDRVNAYGKH